MPRSLQELLDHQDEIAREFEDYEPRPEDQRDPAPFRRTRDAVVRRIEADRELAAAVAAMREADYAWPVIGSLLGTTGEAARQRYGNASAVREDQRDRTKWLDADTLVNTGSRREHVEAKPPPTGSRAGSGDPVIEVLKPGVYAIEPMDVSDRDAPSATTKPVRKVPATKAAPPVKAPSSKARAAKTPASGAAARRTR